MTLDYIPTKKKKKSIIPTSSIGYYVEYNKSKTISTFIF